MLRRRTRPKWPRYEQPDDLSPAGSGQAAGLRQVEAGGLRVALPDPVRAASPAAEEEEDVDLGRKRRQGEGVGGSGQGGKRWRW